MTSAAPCRRPVAVRRGADGIQISVRDSGSAPGTIGCGAIRELEGIRHDAKNDVRLAVEHDRAAGQLRVAIEATVPQPRADHRDIGRIAGAERPADGSVDAEHRKELEIGDDGGQPLRYAGPSRCLIVVK